MFRVRHARTHLRHRSQHRHRLAVRSGRPDGFGRSPESAARHPDGSAPRRRVRRPARAVLAPPGEVKKSHRTVPATFPRVGKPAVAVVPTVLGVPKGSHIVLAGFPGVRKTIREVLKMVSRQKCHRKQKGSVLPSSAGCLLGFISEEEAGCGDAMSKPAHHYQHLARIFHSRSRR